MIHAARHFQKFHGEALTFNPLQVQICCPAGHHNPLNWFVVHIIMFDILLTAVKKVQGRSKNHFGDVIGKIMDATVRYMKNSQCKNTYIILFNSVHVAL